MLAPEDHIGQIEGCVGEDQRSRDLVRHVLRQRIQVHIEHGLEDGGKGEGHRDHRDGRETQSSA